MRASGAPFVFAALACSCSAPEHGPTAEHAASSLAAAASVTVHVLPRTPSLPNHPCRRCHADRAANPSERALTQFHGRMTLTHGNLHGWCYACHATEDLDSLRLPSGARVSFDASFEVCGSCHGEKLRDWRAGLHGLTTGHWNGLQERRACTACHDPHAPRFPAMPTRPAPPRPRRSVPHHEGAPWQKHDRP
jgi:hypothetical protein